MLQLLNAKLQYICVISKVIYSGYVTTANYKGKLQYICYNY